MLGCIIPYSDFLNGRMPDTSMRKMPLWALCIASVSLLLSEGYFDLDFFQTSGNNKIDASHTWVSTLGYRRPTW